MSQTGKQLCAFAHFLPHLTRSLAAKQNKIKQKIHKWGGYQTIVEIIRRNKRECRKKGVVQLVRGRNFRQLVSSMDALRHGWSYELKYCTQDAVRARGRARLLTLITQIYKQSVCATVILTYLHSHPVIPLLSSVSNV